MYQRIITGAADINEIICSFTHKLHFLFINKVRTRAIINLNILDWIKLIEKCSVVVVIEFVCGRNDDSSSHLFQPSQGWLNEPHGAITLVKRTALWGQTRLGMVQNA